MAFRKDWLGRRGPGRKGPRNLSDQRSYGRRELVARADQACQAVRVCLAAHNDAVVVAHEDAFDCLCLFVLVWATLLMFLVQVRYTTA